MSESTEILWDDRYLGYDPQQAHPLHPVRLELTMELAGGLGILDRQSVTVTQPAPAADEQIERVHEVSYLSAVRRAAVAEGGDLADRYGLGPEDNPVFAHMHETSALVAGGRSTR